MPPRGSGRTAPDAARPGAADQTVLRALEIIEKCLHGAQRENKLSDLVAIDLRSVAALRQRFAVKPNDPDSLKFLRQLAMVWSTRLSGTDYRSFRELFNLIDKCAVPNR